MSPFNTLILGLGLFFLGLRLVGDNLRRLSGSGFRQIIKRTTHSPLLGAALGLVAGALMQSATAVTFIMVSMSGSGMIKPRAAAPIIIWCNVGLTVLAFVATLDIHPVVALIVGGAGIVLGTIRNPTWQSVAGGLLGMGLILLGLGQMSAGAAPLKDAAWFQHAISLAVSSAPLAFLAGVAAAAVLQSNTGAAMLVITFTANKLISFDAAMLLIYGANLGAIGLRIFLASGLKGAQLRLVRLEDFFCVAGAVLMLVLYALEQAGVPLVSAWVHALAQGINTQLALVFLLSNLLPALALSPLIGHGMEWLRRFWPDRVVQDPAEPRFLTSQSLSEPATALDLMVKELARLLGTIAVKPRRPDDEEEAPPAFTELSNAIEDFAARLAAQNTLNQPLAARLHLLRAELSIIRHIEEGVRYFSEALEREGGSDLLRNSLEKLLGLAVCAAENAAPGLVAELDRRTKLKGGDMAGLQRQIPASLGATALFEDFSIAVWTIHRLAKLLAKLPD